MYVFITVHVQGVGVCWCVCAIGDAILVRCACVRACMCRVLCVCATVDVVSAFTLLSFSSLDSVANYVMSSFIIIYLNQIRIWKFYSPKFEKKIVVFYAFTAFVFVVNISHEVGTMSTYS